MISLSFQQARAGFFDREKVLRALDKARRGVLSRFGAFMRRRAQTSIRKRKAVSEPGQPPSGHTGLYRKLIFFSYDAAAKAVVIGPTQSRPDSQVPKLLEYGGTAQRRTRKGTRTLRYRARPHMAPALAAELPNFPRLWANSVRA